MAHELKRLTTQNLEAALAKASTYRDLNQPEEAESICQDVLDVDAKNQHALRVLGLALTDRLTGPLARPSREGAWVGLFEQAIAVFERLTDEYERVYYKGVAWERSAKAHLERGEAHSAMSSFEHAMDLFERAQALAPRDLPDPILRYNRCVRLLTTHPLLLAAADDPRESAVHLGD
jgi:tetratricopeptide (TPR) repeat protein